VVEAAQGGVFVPPGDDVALADAVYSLSQDRQRAAAMGRAARSYVVEQFNHQQYAAQFLELVQRLVGGERMWEDRILLTTE
jgi:glycosyltransferase involved in cell wall biosynthesis